VPRYGKRAADLAIWLLLLSMPFWLNWIGGYTSLGSRVLVLALAAMSLNFLLGFTGVLSFGHAAYFGLGAYGVGLTIKYLVPNTLAGMAVGVLAGTLAAAIIGALIVRLRGIYFAMVTIAFGQVFYFIAFRWNAVTGGDDGLSGWQRQPIDVGFTAIDILGNDRAFYYLVLVCFALAVAIMAALLRSPFGRTLLAIRENERRALSRHSGGPPHLALLGDLLHIRQSCRHALGAAQQFRRSARSALGSVRRFRDHGGARRHARLLGSTDRRRNIRCAAGLHFERDGQLDVVHRAVLRAGRIVLPARRAGHRPAEDRAMSLLEVENVSRRFGSLVAVNNISMSVEPGELRAVIGPNGAGKTTFFNLISGFLSPSSGRSVFDGEDITGLLPARRVWRGMARTFQVTEIFPELSVRENLRIAVEVAAGYRLRPWISRAENALVDARVAELSDMGGLAGKRDNPVGELSHGDQRATEIMMALALNPRLLLLDEPTAGMGDQETYNITQLIRRLHRDHKLSIVLIEHDMRVVFHLADRIMVLAEGAMLAEGTAPEIAASEAVQTAYLGEAA
jgi:branched-chain amino acid transport system ATP-binding protein